MSVISEDWVLHGEGHTVIRDDLRRDALQEWAIIEKTISISVHGRPDCATERPSHRMDIAAMGTADA